MQEGQVIMENRKTSTNLSGQYDINISKGIDIYRVAGGIGSEFITPAFYIECHRFDCRSPRQLCTSGKNVATGFELRDRTDLRAGPR